MKQISCSFTQIKFIPTSIWQWINIMNITNYTCQPCKQHDIHWNKADLTIMSDDPSLNGLLFKSIGRHSLWHKCTMIVDIFFLQSWDCKFSRLQVQSRSELWRSKYCGVTSSVQSEGRDHCPCQQAPRDVLNGDGVSSVKIQNFSQTGQMFECLPMD